jgi:hypothetical protein
MPIHDWSRVPSGLFHAFHQAWSIRIMSALNSGILPKGMSALVEQRANGWEPDVLAIEERGKRRPKFEDDGGLLTLEPPATRMVFRTDEEVYADKANRIVVKHQLGRTLAIIEIVSPGNKDSRVRIGDFVEKAAEFIRNGVHLLVVDLFPPTARDPLGIHQLIWNELTDEAFEFPAGKDRILASYEAGREKVAYVEPVAVGDDLPNMPLFLAVGKHIKVPLESTYQLAWTDCSEGLREVVETGVLPEAADDAEQ